MLQTTLLIYNTKRKMEKLKDISIEAGVKLKLILLSSLLFLCLTSISQNRVKVKHKRGGHYEITYILGKDTCSAWNKLPPPHQYFKDSLLLFSFDLAHELSTGFNLECSVLLDSCRTKRIPIFGYGPEKKQEYGLSPRKFRIGRRNRRGFVLKIGDLKCLKLKYKDFKGWNELILIALEEIKQEVRSSPHPN